MGRREPSDGFAGGRCADVQGLSALQRTDAAGTGTRGKKVRGIEYWELGSRVLLV